jgi:hypothetical protein
MSSISVARDFTRFPAGRYKRNGSTSGESFRERFLHDRLAANEPVTVDLDGTVGYGSSFLEEAFGGLVRHLRMPPQQVLSLLSIKTVDKELEAEVIGYITDAGRRL